MKRRKEIQKQIATLTSRIAELNEHPDVNAAKIYGHNSCILGLEWVLERNMTTSLHNLDQRN